MKHLLAIFLILFTTAYLSAQEKPVSPRLTALASQIAAGNSGAVEDLWQEVTKQGTPLIEPTGEKGFFQVTFLWRSKEDTNTIVTWEAAHTIRDQTLDRFRDTDIWYKTYRVRDDARFFYRFSVNDPNFPFVTSAGVKYPEKYQVDPLSLNQWRKQFGVVELPNAPSMELSTRKPDVPKGITVKLVPDMKSSILGNERRVFVYKPVGYDPKGKPYPVLFFGASYLNFVPLPIILDNLIAQKKIPPVVAVLVDFPDQATLDREQECDPKFDDFLVKELLPRIREDYHITNDPTKTIIGGASMGGLSAACTALRYPGIFGNVLAQSGSFWWAPAGGTEDGWLTREIAARPRVPVRFFLSIGLLEGGSAFLDGRVSMTQASRHLRDVLRAKGNTVSYREINAGHEPYNWSVTLPEGLVALLSKP